jgi:hypothetical protein
MAFNQIRHIPGGDTAVKNRLRVNNHDGPQLAKAEAPGFHHPDLLRKPLAGQLFFEVLDNGAASR